VTAALIGMMTLAGCHNSILGPARPAEALRPEIIGLIVDFAFWNGHDGRYTLDTGDVVELNAQEQQQLPSTPRVSRTRIAFHMSPAAGAPDPPSTLLLVGHRADGLTWYAAANERQGDAVCPFEIAGEAVFDEGDRLWFGSGLVLPKADGFEVLPEWAVKDPYMGEPFPLGGADQICIDRSGSALSATTAFDY
jgi:hypothetical protein